MAKMVEVIWVDACIENADIPKEAAEQIKPMQRTNVGYVLAETKEEINICYGILVNRYSGGNAYMLSFSIPKGCILDIKELE